MSDKLFKLQCYVCREFYREDADVFMEWAESGRDYDPTDWVCPRCFVAIEAAIKANNAE